VSLVFRVLLVRARSRRSALMSLRLIFRARRSPCRRWKRSSRAATKSWRSTLARPGRPPSWSRATPSPVEREASLLGLLLATPGTLRGSGGGIAALCAHRADVRSGGAYWLNPPKPIPIARGSDASMCTPALPALARAAPIIAPSWRGHRDRVTVMRMEAGSIPAMPRREMASDPT